MTKISSELSRLYRRFALGNRCIVVQSHKFASDSSGAAMVETLIITPVILILLAGVLEFGGMLVNKVELETGLRDAARYLARCQDFFTGTPEFGCSATTARNIAVYGLPTVSDPPPTPRVPGWQASDIVIDSQGPKLINNPVNPITGLPDYRGPPQIYVVRVETDIDYPGGTLLGLTGVGSIPMAAFHEERFIGW